MRASSKSKQTKIRVLGVMTGTSLDGGDCACIEFQLKQGEIRTWTSLWTQSFPILPRLRKDLLDVQLPKSQRTLLEFLRLERDYSLWLTSHLSRLLLEKPPSQRPHALAVHGQTLSHHPTDRPLGLTLQILNPHILATQIKLPVLSDFRRGDIAAKGQGAPLVPLFHKALLDSKRKGASRAEQISLHNLGGISNLTLLGPGNKICAWDTGPANCWIDAAVSRVTQGKKTFDRDGRMASVGTVHEPTVSKILSSHPYFKKAAPKSTGRDDFPFDFFLAHAKGVTGPDLVATATEITARSIAQEYVKNSPKIGTIYFCGGGAKNITLLNRIQELLPHAQISSLPTSWSDPQFVEAEAFAYFGARALLGKSLGGSWTGAMEEGSPATLTIPSSNSWKKLLSQIQI